MQIKEQTKFIKHISNIIAVDGKAIRSTKKQGKPNSALQIITADAMYCQKQTCEKIVKKGRDYVFGLKSNQKNLYEDVKRIFNNPLYAQEFKTYEKNTGRREIRICRKIRDFNTLKNKVCWSTFIS